MSEWVADADGPEGGASWGGSWTEPVQDLTNATFEDHDPAARLPGIGFRVVRAAQLRSAGLRLDDGTGGPGTAATARVDELVELALVAGGHLDEDVVGYWPLDREQRAASAVEERGPGTLEGSAQLGWSAVPGPFEGSLAARLVGEGFTVPGAADLALGGEITACAWAQPDPRGTFPLLSWSVRGEATFGLVRDEDNVAPALAVNTDAGRRDLMGPGDSWPADGSWHHVCGTHDGITAALYFDGRLVATEAVSGPLPSGDAGALVGGICGGGLCDNDAPRGGLTDVVLLRRALSPREVRLAFEARRRWGTPTFPGAQPDYDDLRLTEDGRPVEFEILGARPTGTVADDLDQHVVAYWSLDDGRPSPLDERAPGELTHGAPTTVPGPTGTTATGFDGATGFRLWADRQFRFGDRFTVELWMRSGGVPSTARLVTNDSSPIADQGWGFDLTASGLGGDAAGRVHFVVWDAAGMRGNPPLRLVGPRVDDSRWHHLAAVREQGRVTLYVDGRPVATQDGLVTSANWDARNYTSIGYDDNGRVGWFQGAIDEVVLHAWPRSADYIYKRAHRTPVLRFFARTQEVEGGRPRYPNYSVGYGSPTALASNWRPADGLLTLSRGYLRWYRFDDRDPLVDSSSRRLHATVLAQPAPTLVPGALGAALDFANTAATLATYPGGPARGPFTLEVASASDGAGGPVFGVEGGNALQLHVDGNSVVGLLSDGNSQVQVTSDGAPSLAEWHAYFMSRLTPEQPVVTVGWDGQARGTEADPTGDLDLGGRTPEIGGLTDGEVRFDGRIDEVRLMNRALSSAALLPVTPTRAGACGVEICNGLDDDCDGEVDEAVFSDDFEHGAPRGWVGVGAPVNLDDGTLRLLASAALPSGASIPVGHHRGFKVETVVRVSAPGVEPAVQVNLDAESVPGASFGQDGIGVRLSQVPDGVLVLMSCADGRLGTGTLQGLTLADGPLRLRLRRRDDLRRLDVRVWRDGAPMPAEPLVLQDCDDTPLDHTHLGLAATGEGVSEVAFDEVELGCQWRRQLDAGEMHTCLIRRDGTLRCWGQNHLGQASPPAGRFVALALGSNHSCAIREDLTVACWGTQDARTAAPAGRFVEIAAGDVASCGVRPDGSVECWTAGNYGVDAPPPGPLRDVTVGYFHACARSTRPGQLHCWGGANGEDHGQLPNMPGAFRRLAASAAFTCLLDDTGAISCPGTPDFPLAFPEPTDYHAIDAGAAHACAVRQDGQLVCDGAGSGEDSPFDFGQSIPPDGVFDDVRAGGFHTCATRPDGSFVCWGNDVHGQLTP